MYLPMLNDEELLAYYASTVDTLTTTDLERELYRRFAARVEQDADPRIAVLDEWDVDSAATLAALLHALDEACIYLDDTEQMEKRIKQTGTLLEVLREYPHVFNDLAMLAETL